MTVSHETYNEYFRILSEWSVNSHLVQPRTLDDFYTRHIQDSIQLTKIVPSRSLRILDIGTGAGFPGVVFCIEGYTNVSLCEPDAKKVFFLEELLRKLHLKATILPVKVQNISSKYDVIVSRAFTNLDSLLGHFLNVSHETSVGIFPKGETWKSEIDQAQTNYDFEVDIIPSITNTKSTILRITKVQKR